MDATDITPAPAASTPVVGVAEAAAADGLPACFVRADTQVTATTDTVTTPAVNNMTVTTTDTAVDTNTATTTTTTTVVDMVNTTTIDTEVVTDILTTIGQRIIAGHDRARRGAQEWIEGTLEMAAALAEARGRFSSDNEFGDWLTGQGHNLVSKNDRAALINLGRDIPTARKVLEETESRSYRLVWDKVKDWFPSAGKPPRKKPAEPPEKAVKSPDEAAEAAKERSRTIEEAQLANVMKNGCLMPEAAPSAEASAEAEAEPEPVDPVQALTETLKAYTPEETRAALSAEVKDAIFASAVNMEKAHVAKQNHTLERFYTDVKSAMGTHETDAEKIKHVRQLIRKFDRAGDLFPKPSMLN